jgi:large subunit ribosomal protein L21
MYAVIETGGKQYRVKEGETLRVEKLETESGKTVEFNKVLLVANGEQITFGKPYIDGGLVRAAIVEHGRGKKIRIIKFRRRKNSRRQMGHRQDYTAIKIEAINAS